MDGSPHSKHPDYELFAWASFDNPCSRKPEPGKRILFRFAENGSEGIAGNARPTVHTAPAFNPML
jgi:hypothetical protein